MAMLLAIGNGCAQDTPSPVQAEEEPLQYWAHENAGIYGETPPGWELTQETPDAWQFHRLDSPGHTISIQRLTTDTGRGPLKILRQAIKKHLYFTDFQYESKWERRVDTVWAPAFRATYLYLNEPSVRYGLLLPTSNGYYEISYHAPAQPLGDGITGYERLLESITMFGMD